MLLPVHAREELDDAVDLGLLKAAFGVCALTGSLVYGALGSRFRRWPVFTIAFLIGGLPRFVVAAFTDTLTPLAVIMAVEGLAFGVLNPHHGHRDVRDGAGGTAQPRSERDNGFGPAGHSAGRTGRGLPRGFGRLVHHPADGWRCVSDHHAVPGDLPSLEKDGQHRFSPRLDAGRAAAGCGGETGVVTETAVSALLTNT
ncbi:MFS transporter [Streptomyces sp. NPDC052069]|uniref:MFS transporter n=1 Tax=Streptomyces sp. NPDC052069 TaxID=3154650 RepID=UPI00343FB80E